MKSLLLICSLSFLFSCATSPDLHHGIQRKLAQTEAIEPISVGELQVSESFITPYGNQSALKGNLENYFTSAHKAQMIEQYEINFLKKLEADGYDLNKVTLLPLQVKKFNVYVADIKGSMASLRADAVVDFQFLYFGENPPQNINRVDQDIKIIVKEYGSNVVAEVDGSIENFRSLVKYAPRASLYSSVDISDVSRLNLDSDQKNYFKTMILNQLKKRAHNNKPEDAKLSLHVQFKSTDGKVYESLIDSTEFKNSKLVEELNLSETPVKKASCGAMIAKFFGL